MRLPRLDQPRGIALSLVRYGVPAVIAILAVAAVGGGMAARTWHVQLGVRTGGTLQPASVWWIVSPEAGTISAIDLAEGDSVREGQRMGSITLQRRSRPGGLARPRTIALAAPTDGIVLSRTPERLIGVVVSRGDSVLSIGDTRAWVARLPVSEKDLAKIAIGDAAILHFPALAEYGVNRVHAAITSVPRFPLRGAGAPSGTTETYEVVAAIGSDAVASLSGTLLRPGLTVEAHIVTDSATVLQLIRRYLGSGSRTSR